MAKVEKKGSVSPELLREFLREMLLIRRFEEKVEERFRAGELPGFLHVAIGQEAVAVGVCRALEEGDVIASTHRAHGHTIAKGTHPNEVMAELYGKLEGCSHGYGGSMHLYDAYGMKSMTVDGQEVGKVHETAAEAVEHARAGRGPVLLVANTYRLTGHYVGDPQVYRPKDELKELRETQDPIDKLRAELDLSDDEFEELDREVTELVEGSVEFAKAGTDPRPEDALKNVYA